MSRVEAAHGAGGRAMGRLIDELFRQAFDNPLLNAGDDFAAFEVPAGRMVMSTDAHVITPLTFPGGDIGALSVHGTVNDVAMSGARPLYLSAAFILEEGFSLEALRVIVESMARAAREAGVSIVTGDTKVVPRGKGDGVYITTTGVGVLGEGINISGSRARAGDRILISGPIAEHGVAVLAAREGLALGGELRSDSAALNGLVEVMLAGLDNPDRLHCLRDPTRGGVAAALNEMAAQSGVGMRIDEALVPLRTEVAAACELLGLEPLQVANEGRLIAICEPESADGLLAAMRAHPLGEQAAIIGEVVGDDPGRVALRTRLGAERWLEPPHGEPLPRIC